MSAAVKVLERARQMGVKLEARGGPIAYDAPYTVLTAELAELLRQHKAELLALRKPADPLHPAERCLVWELDTADGIPCWRLRHPDHNIAHGGTTE